MTAPEKTVLERAKKALIDDDMTYEDYDECISLLIAEVERLRSLNESLMENGNDLRTRCQKAEANACLISVLRNLAPAMIEVLRCSQGGDAVELDRIGRILERAFNDPTALLGYTREDRLDMLDCIKRHQKAASLMEDE